MIQKNQFDIISFEKDNLNVQILPFGGRVLQVNLGNFKLLWENPEKEVLLKNKSWNVGGIRTWLSPEQTFFYAKPNQFQEWYCPSGIDPANYQILHLSKESILLESEINAINNFTGEKFVGQMQKKISLIGEEETKKAIEVKLDIQSKLNVENYIGPFALWTIAQVPICETGKGKVVIPVRKNTSPISYFDPIPPEYLKYGNNQIEFLFDGKKELKLGIRPEDLLKKNGEFHYFYYLQGKKIKITISAKSAAGKQEECVDLAKSNPKGPKATIQVYNSAFDKSGLKYGELEIQHTRARKNRKGKYLANENAMIAFTIFK